jgi:hypothetical protein
MEKKPEVPKKKTAHDAEDAYADELPEPQERNKDVISYRRPKPGETFLGGRGVILGTPLFSGQAADGRSKEEEEFKQRALKAFDKVLKKEAEAQFGAPPIDKPDLDDGADEEPNNGDPLQRRVAQQPGDVMIAEPDENDSAISSNSSFRDEEQETPYRRPLKGWKPTGLSYKSAGLPRSSNPPALLDPDVATTDLPVQPEFEETPTEDFPVQPHSGSGALTQGLELLGMVSFFALQIGAVVLWIWSVFLAFKSGGLIAAFVTAVIPVLSQVYWAWTLWPSAFSQVFLLWVLISLIPLLIAMLGAAFNREK